MKLIYIVNARIPTEKAHGIQITKMCEAFANQGLEVELVVPWRLNKIKKNTFQYYGLSKNFKIKKLPALDIPFFNPSFIFRLKTLSFLISTFIYLFFQKRDSIIYSRGEIVLGLTPFMKKRKVIWETHIKPQNVNLYKKVLKKVKGLVVVTKYYKKELIEQFDLSSERVLCLPDGVDLEKFDIDISKEEARKDLILPQDKKIVLSTSSFLNWKGLDILFDVVSKFRGTSFVFVGSGEKEDVERIKRKASNLSDIFLTGHKPRKEIPLWLKSADVLVLTGTSKSEVSKHYTSPMKLFEYMASGRPIVASKIESFLDILNEENSVLVEADNPSAMFDGIGRVLGDQGLAKRISEKAFRDVQNYTWQKRAERVINFIKK
ncbi:glycosyltransferase [Patescibacteria group bacterium]